MLSSVSANNLFSEIPTIDFYPENCHCSICGSKLKVMKTHSRTVYTLDIGGFSARETILECPDGDSVYYSEQLQSLVPYRCSFGFDVMLYVGKALFVRCIGEQQIKKELQERNIPISDRGISYLGKKFIIYLAIAHRESREQLKEAMATKGGYILHLDGTCEQDSPHLITGLDGISEIVLDNIKLPSEKAEMLIPFLKGIKEQYGDPVALVRDMGKSISSAIEAVFPSTRDYICHYHFLRDIGKDLFEDEYGKIRNILKKHKIKPLLRQKDRYLQGTIDDNAKIVNELKVSIEKGRLGTSFLREMPILSTCALINWALDTSDQLDGYGFPFDRPHLVFYQNLKVMYSALNEITNNPPAETMKDYKLFYKVRGLLENVIYDKELSKLVLDMEEKVKVFDKLREAMRIALPKGKDGLNDNGNDEEMNTIEKRVKDFKKWLESDKTLSHKDDYKNLLKQIDKYWEKLFADPIKITTPQGQFFIQPQRTNNILERLFRDFKRRYRKRSGMISLNKILKAILADTPLVKNLENENYLKIILNGCSTLEERFAKIDSRLVTEELKSLKKNTDKLTPEMKKIIKKKDLPKIITNLFVAN